MNALFPQTRLAMGGAAPLLVDNINVEGFHGIAVLTSGGGTANVEGFHGIAVLNGKRGRNHLRWSQAFDERVTEGGGATKWQSNRLAVDTDNTTAPDGTTTAEFVKISTTTGNHMNYQIWSAQQRQYCLSCYIKQPASNRHQYFSLYFSDGVSVNKKVVVDTDTMLAVVTDAGISNFLATSVGSGWYRISCVYTYLGTYATANIGCYLTNSTGSVSFTGVLNEGLYMWGAQVNPGNAPDIYCPTDGTALP